MTIEETEVLRIFGPHTVWLVGGAVRDKLLGRNPVDFDFATSLMPDQIERCIRDAGRRPYRTNKRFGTIGVRVDGRVVEITTFHITDYSSANRHPIFGVSLDDDLCHRDFTINAMAMRDDRLYDPWNGLADLKNRAIVCPPKAKERFKEDPLRILRMARLEAELGFQIGVVTKTMATELSYKLLSVSHERWVAELDKLLLSERPSIGLETLMEIRAMNYILPEVAVQRGYDQDNPHHTLNLWEHTKQVVASISPTVELRWAALLHDVGKPFVRTTNKKGYSNYIRHDLLGGEFVRKIGRYLKWANDRTDTIAELVEGHLSNRSPLRAADQKAK